MSSDRFDLQRFVAAQAPVFDAALEEMRAGRKRTHWMWFVFPQLRALGQSSTARFYGIASLDEARAYHADPLLGPRLTTCTLAVLESTTRSLHDLFGSPDDLKFRSCMTLFDAAVPDANPVFAQTLDRWCAGERDPRTLELIASTVDG